MRVPLVYNVRNVRERWRVALLAVVGIAMVVTAFAVLMAMSQGFAAALRGTGRLDNAMVVGRGTNSESMSSIGLDERAAIVAHELVARRPDGQPLASWESVSIMALPRRKDGRRTNVTVRGVTPGGYEVRTGIRMVAGRPLAAGTDEVIVGRRILERVRGLELGSVLRVRRRAFRIVGVFEAEGAGFESEVWGDFDVVGPLFRRRGNANSLVVRVRNTADAVVLDRWLRAQPAMMLRAVSERQYYEEQAGPMAETVKFLAGLVALVMGVGAVFGAMNTMYGIVAARTREIGTLRALGFSRRAILGSVIAESALLALLGGVLGCLLALPIHGYSTSASNLQTFSEVAFAFRITPAILAISVGLAGFMGVAGGLLPAIRAARLPIAAAIREP